MPSLLPRSLRAAALVTLLAVAIAVPRVTHAQSACDVLGASATEPVAVVLSGGGARGLAHIGALRVLDSLGLRPRIVVGTSMGALVGALYAGGRSGRSLDSLARALPLEELFRPYPPIALLTIGDLAGPVTVLTPTFVVGSRGGGTGLLSPVAREPEINALLDSMLLGTNLAAAGDFDRLPRRFRAVATDMRSRSAVVLRDDDLAQAVRASIAIPVVFAPVLYRGRLLVDGGLADNVPVAAARDAGAARVIVVDVGPSVADSVEGATTSTMLGYLVEGLFTQPPDTLTPRDVRVRPEVRAFDLLNFSRVVVDPLVAAGYRAAAETFRGCRVPAAEPRVAMPDAAPARADRETARVAARLSRLARRQLYESVWLHPRAQGPAREAGDGATVSPDVVLAPVAVPMPPYMALGGISYDAHEGARGWLALANVTPSVVRLRLTGAAAASAWEQRALVDARLLARSPLPRASPRSARGRQSAARSELPAEVELPDPRSGRPPWSASGGIRLDPEVSATASRTIVRLYDDRGRERARPTARELVAFAGLGVAPTERWQVAVGPALHLWRVRDPAAADRAVGALVRAARVFAPPPSGPDMNAAPRAAVEGLWLDRYRRASAEADLHLGIGRLVVRPRAGAGWGERLPLGALLPLGGRDGLPGLRLGERRGDRIAYGALALSWPVVGPFFVRAEAGVGRSTLGRSTRATPIALGDGTVRGAELGVTATTPFGPIVIGYGASSTGRPLVRVRLGG